MRNSEILGSASWPTTTIIKSLQGEKFPSDTKVNQKDQCKAITL